MSVAFLLLLAALGAYGQTCSGRCGDNDPNNSCQCNTACTSFGDCCSDYTHICLSCADRCGEAYLNSKPCQCNTDCGTHSNCCSDYDDQCGGSGGGVTDEDLWTVTEDMFAAEVNAVGDQLTINVQGEGTSGDLASGPLFTLVPDSALSGPTITLLRQVQDNYVPQVTTDEDQTAAEIAEQDALLDAMMSTQVMKLAESFLKDKSLLTGSLRDKLDEIWFTLYSRSSGPLGSSGFEHSFVGELKNGKVSGFHNWVNFYKEEQEGDLNYEGWSKVIDLGTKAKLIMDHFEWFSEPKAIGSMFIGTSPELEMATYTVCFLARPDSLCPVQMDNQKFHVQTWTLSSNGKVLVGSAYPDI